jgi:DNA-binding CsgD family transcriptional regulator
LKASLGEYARSQYEQRGLALALEGLVVTVLDDCERPQRLRREPAGIPARIFGLTDRLREWFATRSTAIAESESDLSRFEFNSRGTRNIVVRDWDETALQHVSTREGDPESNELFGIWAEAGLTPAQQAVVRLRALGFSDDEIASQLGLTSATIRSHLRGVRRRIESFGLDPVSERPPRQRR